MTAPFARGLSDDAVADLQRGLTAPLLAACRGLDVRLREGGLNAYAAGRSILRLSWGAGGPTVEVHHKYLGPHSLPGHTRRGDYARLAVSDAGTAAAIAADVPTLIRNAAAYIKTEETSEAQLLQDNAGGGPFVALDRQVGIPGTRSYVDVVGVLDEEALLLVEIKRDLDARIQEVPAQVDRYLGFFSPGGRGLRADVAGSLRRVAEQLDRLGFAAPRPAPLRPGMPVLGLVVLVRYNPRSALLGRAHASAAALPNPVWLWVAERDDALALPGRAAWTRMG